jgi:hypothetical protein
MYISILVSRAALLVTPKKNNEANNIKAVQLLTETNLGLFAQSSFSAQSDVNYLTDCFVMAAGHRECSQHQSTVSYILFGLCRGLG